MRNELELLRQVIGEKSISELMHETISPPIYSNEPKFDFDEYYWDLREYGCDRESAYVSSLNKELGLEMGIN